MRPKFALIETNTLTIQASKPLIVFLNLTFGPNFKGLFIHKYTALI